MPNFFEKHSDTLITVATIILAFAALVNILDQRLDAQDTLINQRFDEVDQRFGIVDQRFDAVDQRFDAQDEHINQRFDAQDEHINQRFDAQDKYTNQRFDAIDKDLDRLTNEVFELRKLTVGISERVSRNEGQIDVIREQLQTADAPSP